VDRENGADLDTIAAASERVSRRLDAEGFDPGPYRLEVTSPGLERALRRPGDFARRVGETVTVRTVEPVDDASVFTGTLLRADEEGVTLTTVAGERAFRYGDIASARNVVDWHEELKRSKR
jgi:ribosome maturation factor RimP